MKEYFAGSLVGKVRVSQLSPFKCLHDVSSTFSTSFTTATATSSSSFSNVCLSACLPTCFPTLYPSHINPSNPHHLSYHHPLLIQESSKFDERQEKEKESAPVDEDDSTSSVVNLTDANFDAVVRESTADILLEFYGEELCVCVCVCICMLCVCVIVSVCIYMCVCVCFCVCMIS